MTEAEFEALLRNWSGPSSDTEQEKQENAERLIGEAIREHEGLAARNVQVFAQGSYRNNTNVRQDSDVDICVCLYDSFFYDHSSLPAFSTSEAGISDNPYPYNQFRTDVHTALIDKFGRPSVKNGNKAFDVKESSTRIAADVVPCFEYREYTFRDYNGVYSYESGTQLITGEGQVIINWPEHHYRNGVAKNNVTGKRFKSVVRILKRLRYRMADQGVYAADRVPSYLVECLVWNVSDDLFNDTYLSKDVYNVLAILKVFLANPYNYPHVNNFMEVNGRKRLFDPGQSWTREDALAFINAAYAEFARMAP